MNKRVKIVIDTDVIIHFIKGESLHLLPKTFPDYPMSKLIGYFGMQNCVFRVLLAKKKSVCGLVQAL